MKILLLVNICLLFLFVTITSSGEVLESISDDDLVHLIKKEEFLITLFSKKNCDECDKIEQHLGNLKDDFRESLGADVVKAFNSQLVRLYNPNKEPAIIFFRHGLPLLYDGPINEDSILQKFYDNKSPVVKELSDDNFEHLTQASSGATTGDWFVMFYTHECIDCGRLTALWEAVGASLKTRLNVARINKGALGSKTAERFKIQKIPEFILIRHGKFYRYQANKYDVKSFVSFAQEFYKNSKGEKIPVPDSPFDDAVMWGVKYARMATAIGHSILEQHPYILIFIITGFGLTAITAIFANVMGKKSAKKEEKKEKKDKKKKAK